MILSLFNNAFQLYCLQSIKMVGLKDFSVFFFLLHLSSVTIDITTWETNCH